MPTRFPLVVLDADSTTLQQEVIDLLAAEAGTADIVRDITERAMQGELDFRESLQERVATLAGADVEIFRSVAKKVRASRGLKQLVAEVHKRRGIVGVVSGGFHEILDQVLPKFDIDIWVANRLLVQDGKLTGQTYGPVIDADAKAATLIRWSEMSHIPLSNSFAIGDGANDLKMMEVAGTSIAFNGKPIVRERADFTVEADLSKVIPLLDHTDRAAEGSQEI